MKMELMSTNLVNIMYELAKNQGLARLIKNDNKTPLKDAVANPNALVMDRIKPLPFEVGVTEFEGTTIRAYYNQGSIDDSEVITESQMHIDIICSRNLWLIRDEIDRSAIRPYEIMGRVIDILGKNSLNKTIRLEFEGYQHLYINEKFDCIRLYANYFSIEKTQ